MERRTAVDLTVEFMRINPMTGEIQTYDEKRYTPSVLPMDRIDLTGRRFFVQATMVRKDHTGNPYFVKGDILSVDYIYKNGSIVVRKRDGTAIPGLWPMERFVEMLEVPEPPAPAKKPGAASA